MACHARRIPEQRCGLIGHRTLSLIHPPLYVPPGSCWVPRFPPHPLAYQVSLSLRYHVLYIPTLPAYLPITAHCSTFSQSLFTPGPEEAKRQARGANLPGSHSAAAVVATSQPLRRVRIPFEPGELALTGL